MGIWGRRMLAIWTMVVGGVIVLFISIHVGEIQIPLYGSLQEVLHKLNMGYWGTSLSKEQQAVFWHIRLPRIIIGLLVGAALSVAGAVMQGVFSNPLADPGIMGISAGASLGAVLAIALGMTNVNVYYMPAFAFIGALSAMSVSVVLTIKRGRSETVSLLLAAVAVSLFFGALTSGILTFLNEYRVKEFLFWMVGGLENRNWNHVLWGSWGILSSLLFLIVVARQLNILSLGEAEAKAMGVNVPFWRVLFLLVASILTAVAVSISGTIGFVGLLVPHIIRLWVGPNYKLLLPLAAVTGAIFLVTCDTVGRVIFLPAEIRVGIMTALVGAPYFLYLLSKVTDGSR